MMPKLILKPSPGAARFPASSENGSNTLGLDRTRFDASLDSGRFADKVQRDIVDGRKLGINGTPTLYINGKRVSDNSYESVKSAIESALKAE